MIPLRRLLQPVLIVTFFGVMASMLARDYVIPMIRAGSATPLAPAAAADQFTARDEWVRVRFNGVPLGTMRSVSMRNGDGFAAWTILRIDAWFVRGTLNAAASLNSRLEMQSATARLDFGNTLGGPRTQLDIAAVADREDLLLRFTSPTGTRHHRLRLLNPPTINLAADQVVAGARLEPGKTYALPVFDPFLGAAGDRVMVRSGGTDTLTLEGEAVPVRIAEMRMGGAVTRLWVDERNRIRRREIVFEGLPNANAEADDAPAPPRFRLTFDNLSPHDPAREDPLMTSLPDPPSLTPADVQGTDSGDPVTALGIGALFAREAFGGNAMDLLGGGGS